MSSAGHEPTNLPKTGAAFQPLGYLIGLKFQMPIKLIRKKGHEFAAKLSDSFDARETDLQDTQWRFLQKMGDSPSGFFRMLIRETEISLEVAYTENRLQWFTDRCGLILDEFRKTFTPAIVLTTTVRINGTLEIDGDSRLFLTDHVTNFNRSRLEVFKSPVQLFGIRFSMPAHQYEVPPKRPPKGKTKKKPVIETVDWHVEAKAESLMTDPSKLYLETLTVWQRPRGWDGATTQLEIDRIEEVSEFLRSRLIPCLTNSPENEGN